MQDESHHCGWMVQRPQPDNGQGKTAIRVFKSHLHRLSIPFVHRTMTSASDRAQISRQASNTKCLINTFHAYLHVFVAQPTELHLSRPLLHTADIRLHDYTQRLFLAQGCATQLIRSCHAARHTAWQFGQWTLAQGEANVSKFTRDTFGQFAEVEVVEQMIEDGRRLSWIYSVCQNGYVAYLLASDWARYGDLSNTQLTLLANNVLVSPVVAKIMPLLSPGWLDQSLMWYHGEYTTEECWQSQKDGLIIGR